MESQSVLLSLGALSLSLVGFASITIAIQRRNLDEWPLHLRLRLRTLVESGSANMALALVPLGLYYLGYGEPGLWHTASLVFGIAVTAIGARIVLRSATYIRSGVMGRFFPILSSLGILALALANLVSFVTSPGMRLASGIYIVGLIGVVVYTASIFVRLLTFSTASDTSERADETGSGAS